MQSIDDLFGKMKVNNSSGFNLDSIKKSATYTNNVGKYTIPLMFLMMQNFVMFFWQNKLLSTTALLQPHLTKILMILKVEIINYNVAA